MGTLVGIQGGYTPPGTSSFCSKQGEIPFLGPPLLLKTGRNTHLGTSLFAQNREKYPPWGTSLLPKSIPGIQTNGPREVPTLRSKQAGMCRTDRFEQKEQKLTELRTGELLPNSETGNSAAQGPLSHLRTVKCAGRRQHGYDQQ